MSKKVIAIILGVVVIIAVIVGTVWYFQKDNKQITKGKCGDGACDNSENNINCLADCSEDASNPELQSVSQYANKKPQTESELKDIIFFDFHAGLMADNPSLFTNHPLVDGVYLGVGWSEVEVKEDVFDFSSLDKNIDIWSKANKAVILRVIAYGQTRGNDVTPQWVKDSVPTITFDENKRGKVIIPKIWDQKFLTEYELFIKALAEHYDSDSRVKYIQIGVGHIGYTNAQPSTEGSKAFLNAGWTLPIWKQYVKSVIDIYSNNFENKKLILAVPPVLMRNYNLVNYIEDGKEITRYAANKGYFISFIGVEPDAQKFEETGFPTLFRDLSSMNLNGFAIGFGDDWPFYGQTGGTVRTADDCQKMLDNIYNLWSSSGKKYPIYIKLLDSELSASEVGNKEFNQQIYDSLKDFVDKTKD